MLSFHKENNDLLNNKCQVTLKKTMVEYLVINNIFVSDLYMDDIANMKYQLHHLHLEQSLTKQINDLNLRHLC